MLSYLNIVIILAIALISLFKVEKRQDDKALSFEQGSCIKGIVAVFLILIHIGNALTNPGSYAILSSIGYLLVAVFFFYSGYGITKKMISNKRYIRKQMPLKVFALFKMIVVTELIYLLVQMIFLNKEYDFLTVIKAVVGIKFSMELCGTL